MIDLILTLMLALVFSFFALQNTQPVTLQFQNYVLGGIPLYFVIVVSALVGLAISLVINLINSISTDMTMFDKDRKIKSTEESLQKMAERVHQLETENAALKATKQESGFEHSPFSRPSLFQKIRHNFSNSFSRVS